MAFSRLLDYPSNFLFLFFFKCVLNWKLPLPNSGFVLNQLLVNNMTVIDVVLKGEVDNTLVVGNL